uniref:Uncharacterized protein n=1 Tax=Magallana gigas TaxID=29159 RepID=K1PTW5_MAGGI
MLSARSGFVFVCLLVVGVESYWYQYLGSGPYFNKNWKQHRRSLSCAESEESCRRSSECCDTKDVCVRDRQQGTQCSDSAECGVGLCCRGVFLFRFGKALQKVQKVLLYHHIPLWSVACLHLTKQPRIHRSKWRNQGRHCCRMVLCRTSTLLRGQSDVTVIPERVTSTAVVRPTNVTLRLIE